MLLCHNDYLESKAIKKLQSWEMSLPFPISLKAGQILPFIKMSPSPVPGREKQLLNPGTLNHWRQLDSYQTRDW